MRSTGRKRNGAAMNGQEQRALVPHKLLTWYETERGVRFSLTGVPQRVGNHPTLHTAMVQHPDGSSSQLVWEPSKLREVPTGILAKIKAAFFSPDPERSAGPPEPAAGARNWVANNPPVVISEKRVSS